MKKSILILIFMTILSAQQFPPFIDGTANRTFISGNRNSFRNGIFIPSKATIKVLYIFAQFKDDNNNQAWQSQNWPLNQKPSWANQLANDVTQYFQEMSKDENGISQFNLQPVVYSNLIITDKNTNEYNNKVGELNKEIILKTDATTNFSDYDNIRLKEYADPSGTNYLQADGTVDMIIIIHRSKQGSMDYDGIAHLYGRQDYSKINDFSLDSKIINTEKRDFI